MPWPSPTNGNYLTLKDPGTITIQLMESEPHEIKTQHFENKKYFDCTGSGCALCARGIRQSVKCKMKVLDLADTKEKILEGTGGLFNQLKKIMDMCNGGKGSSFMIKAEGVLLERRYTVIPMGVAPAIGAKAPEIGDAQDDVDPFSK